MRRFLVHRLPHQFLRPAVASSGGLDAGFQMNETEPDVRRKHAMDSDDRVTRRLGGRRFNAWRVGEAESALRETPVRGDTRDAATISIFQVGCFRSRVLGAAVENHARSVRAGDDDGGSGERWKLDLCV
jgi:hypothetical protein